jgi:hypothetical protein
MPTPTKATAETLSKILDALSVGASRRTAADNARIDEKTLRRWMEQGRDAAPGTKWRKFHEDVLEAEAHPRLRALGAVYNEMPGNVNVAFRFLERREPGFAPPMAQPAAVVQPVVIELSFHDGSAIAESYIEGRAIEQDETAATVLELPAAGSTPPGQAS